MILFFRFIVVFQTKSINVVTLMSKAANWSFRSYRTAFLKCLWRKVWSAPSPTLLHEVMIYNQLEWRSSVDRVVKKKKKTKHFSLFRLWIFIVSKHYLSSTWWCKIAFIFPNYTLPFMNYWLLSYSNTRIFLKLL